jgi:hypothetical protein
MNPAATSLRSGAACALDRRDVQRPMEGDHLGNRFRPASRELRNHYFHPRDWDEDEWEVVESFDEIERLLLLADQIVE